MESCTVCDRTVKSNQHAIECSKCCAWVHKGCSGLPNTQFDKICAISKKSGSHNWECFLCHKVEVKRASLSAGDNRKPNKWGSQVVNSNTEPAQGTDSESDVTPTTASGPEFTKSSTEMEVKNQISNLAKKPNTSNKDVVGLLSNMLGLLMEQKNDMRLLFEELRVNHLTRINKLENEMVELRKTIERLDNSIEANTNGTSKTDAVNEVSSESLFNEFHDRAQRAKNIIIHEIPESNSQDTRVRINHDLEQVAEILGKLDVSTRDFKAIRLGRPGNKIRPLKVLFNNENVASSCLKNRRLLRDSIRLNADLTIMQRDQIRKAYAELDQRKQKGEKNLNVKFIKGIPKVVTGNDSPKNDQ